MRISVKDVKLLNLIPVGVLEAPLYIVFWLVQAEQISKREAEAIRACVRLREESITLEYQTLCFEVNFGKKMLLIST